MKQTTAVFKKKRECKHSIVFESSSDNAPATSVYVSKTIVPAGATECKISVCFPDGGQDAEYNNLS